MKELTGHTTDGKYQPEGLQVRRLGRVARVIARTILTAIAKPIISYGLEAKNLDFLICAHDCVESTFRNMRNSGVLYVILLSITNTRLDGPQRTNL